MKSPLVEQILAAAKPHPKTGWFAALPEDQKGVVLEVRDRWRASKSASGVSAAQMARAIVAQMPTTKFPAVKELAAWLNRDQPQ